MINDQFSIANFVMIKNYQCELKTLYFSAKLGLCSVLRIS